MESKRDIDSRESSGSEDFYEVMPLTGSHYVYRDDVVNDVAPERIYNNAKITAIITLILVGLVALALGILLAKSLQTLRANTQVTATNSQLEL